MDTIIGGIITNLYKSKAFCVSIRYFSNIILAILICSCGSGRLPNITDPIDIPLEIPDWPGIPSTLHQLPEVIEELNLPDISQIANLPSLADLPFFQKNPPGAIVYNGPIEKSIQKGQKISGTDIELVAIEGDQVELHIGGLRSLRTIGDSLDFDGGWPGIAGVEYYVRLRIYRIGNDNIRVAGVHQLIIQNIQPIIGEPSMEGFTLKFPFTTNADVDEIFSGMTYGYIGEESRGGQISGLPENEYPYRKLGDSIHWRGFVRSDLPIVYNIRLLLYNNESARVGGTVTVELPAN